MDFAQILFYIHYAAILLFGILLSVSFSGIRFSKKNIWIWSSFYCLCGLGQLAAVFTLGEEITWKTYPLFVHLPLMLFLVFREKKRPVTAAAAVVTAYLCCQPAKWVGLFSTFCGANIVWARLSQIAVLILFGAVIIIYFAPYLSEIYQKDTKSVLIFSGLPMVYYLFDYSAGIYTDLWISNNRVVVEFLPFLFCAFFLVFCWVYYKEYERKADAERSEQVAHITVLQQEKEIKALKKGEEEIRLLRHDMHHFLNLIAVCLAAGDVEKAKEIISSCTEAVDKTKGERFCRNDTLNYVLAAFAEKSRGQQVVFEYTAETEEYLADETTVVSIVSNLLENALHAQQALACEKRKISFLFKEMEGKRLISVKNPIESPPVFMDGLPISEEKGHGFGCRSVKYMTERLGGSCQFTVSDGFFIARVII